MNRHTHFCKHCKKGLVIRGDKIYHEAYFGKKCPIMPEVATARQGVKRSCLMIDQKGYWLIPDNMLGIPDRFDLNGQKAW